MEPVVDGFSILLSEVNENGVLISKQKQLESCVLLHIAILNNVPDALCRNAVRLVSIYNLFESQFMVLNLEGTDDDALDRYNLRICVG